MQVRFAYAGHSQLDGGLLRLLPNLDREPVSFDAPLASPLRYREAMSALHDVVISDLRFKPRDKTAYDEWKKQDSARRRKEYEQHYKQAREQVLARQATVPPDLERQYERLRQQYWDARLKYSDYLSRQDQELWRMLVPCDPIVTVADDVVFFECFSADESSYGCLTVQRDAFGPSENVRLGTTNVDYSWDLYHHFQALRTYRETRLRVDPAGFEVATQGAADYREEKIDLPAGWLRGLAQVQAAMTLPMRRVTLARPAVYSLLAWLKRHKAKASPRALRFELVEGRAPRIVLEPWEQAIESHGTTYSGPGGEPIRVWGRQRLLVLARLLPLVERIDVYLLGTGLPSFWVAQMGEMRLTLGLSGWTTNDWTRNAALDVIRPPVKLSEGLVSGIAQAMRTQRTLRLGDAGLSSVAAAPECAAGLNYLAHAGQVIYDLDAGVYRWRQIMPRALGEAEIGPENAELVASRQIIARGHVRIATNQETPGGGRAFTGTADNHELEMLLDRDGIIKRGKCKCSHHFKGGLRMGPCRHLLALRSAALGDGGQAAGDLATWFARWQQWKGN
jgi:hypothetical protein